MTSRYDGVPKLGLIVLALVGLAMAGFGLVADRLGFGRQPGFGPGQASILVIGAVLVLTSQQHLQHRVWRATLLNSV